METTYELPSTLQADLEQLRQHIEEFKTGELSGEVFRSRRVPQGVYEQRQDGTFMLRIRVPGGGLFPHQLRCAAAVARTHGNGRIHVTTRQDIQVHDVPLDEIHPALLELAKAGLSTKGGGGNTVRNVMGCPDAGVCPDEVFDITPYPVALTEFMLPDPVSYQLPRKYKIAFSGCASDCIGASVNDLGFIARGGPDGPGFAVYAGGGMGPQARVAEQLEEFVPAEDICLVAEAVKRLFDKHGNRRNKNRARIRYLVRELGFERFAELYREELAKLRAERPATPALKQPSGRRLPAPMDSAEPAEGFEEWRRCNVRPQKQAGSSFVHLPVFLGDLSSEAVEALADIAERFGEGMLRATPAQNLIMRWVLDAELPGLHRDLSELGLANPLPPVQRDLIACTGSATCRLGICLSQGLAGAVDRELDRAGVDLVDAADLTVHINGCPNSCGRHPIASIGFHGKARRVGERLSPWYVMQLGGRVGEGRTALAEGKDALAARDIPAFLVEYLRAFRESKQYPDFSAFLDDGGRDRAGDILAGYKDIPAFADDKNYYIDWGAEETFSLAGRGAGECSAGVFDLIRVDLASARDALAEGKLFSATVLAARAMLVTQGEEAQDAPDALARFERLFLDAGHVDASFRDLIVAAKERARAASPAEEMEQGVERVTDLVAAVEALYESLDQSLRFHGASADAAKPAETAQAEVSQGAGATAKAEDFAVDREADFRGVTCPLNYVKTKMLLGQMQAGQILSVLLDEEGGKSVPASAAKDGHEILLEEQRSDRWLVLLRKG
jgi:sulfite reductase (ferredoxin)